MNEERGAATFDALDDGWEWLDAKLPHVTPAAVDSALASFPLALRRDLTSQWLALAVRRVLGLTVSDPSESPETRASNAAIRDDLRQLADKTKALWVDLYSMPQATENAILDALFEQSEHSAMERFRLGRDELMTVFSILSLAANRLDASPEKQSSRWRQAALREVRIERAQHLAPVFEMAFNQTATGNNYPADKTNRPTEFMDFYQRIVAVAFDEKATADLPGVVKEALRKHRESALRLAPGIVPGFPNLIQ